MTSNLFYLKGNKNQAMFSYITGRGIHMLQSCSYGPVGFPIELYVPAAGGRNVLATSGRTGIRWVPNVGTFTVLGFAYGILCSVQWSKAPELILFKRTTELKGCDQIGFSRRIRTWSQRFYLQLIMANKIYR